ncbi:putative glycolipid-binding domain-containing protein [Mesorhizobium sp. ZC-5]|uniref:putative glycolipid-binding domain-containing protein n=1 Tax=Mesorhizobium sp. ZC-5 TaxID=2986066 RepID=UPI0021E76578|nr:putative glycolipid-binding domain-containing protein [Mesorhizobium sp. ZC-5]MCV3238527.1 putative glycolipid-binding domain-containing protein [Mesorhizobium sp. ZC-5]
MTELVATILWQRLDVPGHDACRLIRQDDGWELHGHAIFEHEGEPCSLAYAALCDKRWQARSACVRGFRGARDLSLEIERNIDDDWLLNGAVQPGLADLIDVDLGFTPATNLLALRRFDLAIGQDTPAPAAYLAFPELKLIRLEQHYRRQSEAEYSYQGPMFGYDEVLQVAPVGFVTDYPNLWRGKLG